MLYKGAASEYIVTNVLHILLIIFVTFEMLSTKIHTFNDQLEFTALPSYNILTGEFMDHVLDPKYFGGKCEYVYNGEWRKFSYESFCENLHYNEDEKNYRKPYNYHTYRFVVLWHHDLFMFCNLRNGLFKLGHFYILMFNSWQAEATSEGSHEYYDDMLSMLKARKEMNSFDIGVTVGVYYVEGGLSGGEESEFLRNITKHNSQVWSTDQQVNIGNIILLFLT